MMNHNNQIFEMFPQVNVFTFRFVKMKLEL